MPSFVDGSLVPVGGTTYCEFKGTASYFDVVAGGRRAARAGWTYRQPSPGYEAILDHVALMPGAMDGCTVGGEVVVPQAGGFYGGWITSPRRRPVQGWSRNDGLVGTMSAYGAMAEWRLVRRPVGEPTADDIELVETSLPPLDEGEALVRNTFLSVDPYMRGRMNDVPLYVPPFPLGAPMDGGAVGVVESVRGEVTDRAGRAVRRGDTVLHDAGWRTHALLSGRAVRVVDAKAAPAQSYLGILGMPGLTAYAGLLRVGEFRSGDGFSCRQRRARWVRSWGSWLG